jgi:hypothetical protein
VGHTLGSAICSQTAQFLRLILLLQNISFFDKFNQMEVAEFVPVLELGLVSTFAHTRLVWV